ncbi:MAG: hypothetical protein ACHQ2Y_09790 [Candidatus Lutacidiplasmatales archaeon]
MRFSASVFVIAMAGLVVVGFVPGLSHAGAAHSASVGAKLASGWVKPSASGTLDCNGWSTMQKSLRNDPACAHPRLPFTSGGQVTDNGWYIGHDEPNMRFISNVPGSGNNMTYKLTLPSAATTSKGVPTYQGAIAFWLGLALCDNYSFPLTNCTPNSDNNTGQGNLATDAGSSVLEMQFYPPGYPNFYNNVSCDMTHWCASLHINDLECSFNGTCNYGCLEPTNFAFITNNGVPIGPPSPQLSNYSTYNGTNRHVLRMSGGDLLSVSIHDTRSGLFTGVHDLTSKKSGYMVASASNGFMATNIANCSGIPYTYHPEYSTAAQVNIVPWAALQLGVSLDIETGHFELNDSDADDSYCGTTPTGVGSCLSTDWDFDGVPYTSGGWATSVSANARHPSPINLLPVVGHAFGPASNGSAYPIFEFETDVGFTVNSTTNCSLLLPNQCGIPNKSQVPTFAGFYPYFSTYGCQVLFGHVAGSGVKNWGGAKEYGSSVAVYSGTLSLWGTNGAFYPNSC